MRIDTIYKLRTNPALYHYLKYHSYWYKSINRNPDLIKDLEQEMKREYKLTTEDKIKKLNDKINLVASFLEVLK